MLHHSIILAFGLRVAAGDTSREDVATDSLLSLGVQQVSDESQQQQQQQPMLTELTPVIRAPPPKPEPPPRPVRVSYCLLTYT